MYRTRFLGHGLRENLMSKEVAGMVQSRRVKGAVPHPVSWTRIKGEPDVQGGSGNGSVEEGEGSWVGGAEWAEPQHREPALPGRAGAHAAGLRSPAPAVWGRRGRRELLRAASVSPVTQ